MIIFMDDGGVVSPPSFYSHTMTIASDTVNLSQRLGYRFTVGASAIVCNRLGLQATSTGIYTPQNVRVHRVSDGALMAQANIVGADLAWVDVAVTEFTLAAGVSYTISYRFGGSGRPLARNQSGIVYYAGITKTANVTGTTDNLPTSTSGNVYAQSRFGYQ